MAVTGRGRLSSFELLPTEADHIVAWAASELADREKTQTDIYGEFVTKCEQLMKEHRGELEFSIPAFSSFNRYSVRQARLSRRLDETRSIVRVLAEKHDVAASDDLTIIAGEMIKSLVLHMLGDGADGVVPKDIMHLAGAFKSAQQAQNMSTDRRVKEQTKLATRVGEAVDAVARAKGLSAETAEAIKADILGVTR
jgi:Protein of unknown function (DUF3486)